MFKKSIKLVAVIVAGMLAITSCSSDNDVVVTPTANITVTPKTKDFGSVKTNTTSQQVFALTNNGKAELKISSFTFEGVNKSEFTTTGVATTVAIGKTYTFNVVFKPTTEGDKKVILLINSNITRQGIALTGKGGKITTTPSGSGNVITVAGAISTTIPSSLGAPYTTANGFNRYTKLTAPNGKAIHIVVQNKITDEQIRRCQNILQHYLTNLPSSTYGANKTAVANKMADNNAILCLLNGKDGSNPIGNQVTGQPLYQNEIQVEGHSWYMNQNYEHRDAAYEEILHFVHDNGIGVDTNGTPSPRGAAPEFQKEIRAAQKNGLSKNLWGIGSASWITELTAENSLSQEYLASVVDSYYGLWGAWKGSTTHGMWGLYVGKTRADIKTDDPMGYYALMNNKFFHSYITYNARIDASLNGNFSLKFDASKPYTHHSRYLKDITLLGSNNNTVTVNEMNNDITGNSGTNTVIFSGKSTEYTVATSNGVTTVTDNTANRDGVNTLRKVEKLKFTDATTTL